MIEFKNFTKRYPDLTVYENFNLTVDSGKITCILGESGSGKTTLLNAVAGIIRYDGSISAVRCSYVFQTPRLLPNLTVRGNLKLVCTDDKKIDGMLERVRLTEKADSYPINLSGGQSQRVGIARAFLYESEAILLDEPFSSLDLKLKREMTELFFEIWHTDKRDVLFVTHDVDEALSVAHRIIAISGGKVVYDSVLEGEAPRTEPSAATEKMRREIFSVL